MNPRSAPPAPARGLDRLLVGVALVAAFLLVHNYALPLLPFRTVVIDPATITPSPDGPSFAFEVPFDGAEPQITPVYRSVLRFWEGDVRYYNVLFGDTLPRQIGGHQFTHLPGRIIFSVRPGDDPRHNGLTYRYAYPPLHTRPLGQGALAIFVACLACLGWLAWRRRAAPPAPVPTSPPPPRTRRPPPPTAASSSPP